MRGGQSRFELPSCFWRTHTYPFLFHWYPCVGFHVTFPLGVKARVGSVLFTLQT